MTKVLCTGGLGYIGSHTVVELLENDFEVVVIDNLSNSKIETIDNIKKITGKTIKFYKGDVCNHDDLERVFEENQDIFGVIHFAGYKAVGESVREPLMYYRNNLMSTIELLETMKKYNCRNIVFSSSACVYAADNISPIDENGRLEPSNPYGRTKYFNEEILRDFHNANPTFDVTILRYFNPIGAHESGLLGEDPNGIPNNLMPYICKVAVGKLDHLNIFGNDYNTKDGTGVRDYIHVVDLAIGHVLAIKRIMEVDKVGIRTYNLGTSVGYSVMDVVNAFNNVNGNVVRYEIAPRRPGDIDSYYSSAAKAEYELGFKATRTLEEMCKSSYEFEKNNDKK